MSGVLSVVDGEDKKLLQGNPSLVLPYVVAAPPTWLYRFDSTPDTTVFEKGFETQGCVFDVGHHRGFDGRGLPTVASMLDGFVGCGESPRAAGRAYGAWLVGDFKRVKQQRMYLQELHKQLDAAEKVTAGVCRTAREYLARWESRPQNDQPPYGPLINEPGALNLYVRGWLYTVLPSKYFVSVKANTSGVRRSFTPALKPLKDDDFEWLHPGPVRREQVHGGQPAWVKITLRAEGTPRETLQVALLVDEGYKKSVRFDAKKVVNPFEGGTWDGLISYRCDPVAAPERAPGTEKFRKALAATKWQREREYWDAQGKPVPPQERKSPFGGEKEAVAACMAW